MVALWIYLTQKLFLIIQNLVDKAALQSFICIHAGKGSIKRLYITREKHSLASSVAKLAYQALATNHLGKSLQRTNVGSETDINFLFVA